MSQERIAAIVAALPATVGGYVGLTIAFLTSQPLWIQFALALGPVLLAGLMQMGNTWLKAKLEQRSTAEGSSSGVSERNRTVDRPGQD